MTQALLVSNAVLWMVVVLLACVVAALARQIGVLHERVAPAGALMVGKGPAVGEPAPVVRVEDLAGMVNRRVHLESLFEAKERAVASLQDFLRAAEEQGGAVQR